MPSAARKKPAPRKAKPRPAARPKKARPAKAPARKPAAKGRATAPSTRPTPTRPVVSRPAAAAAKAPAPSRPAPAPGKAGKAGGAAAATATPSPTVAHAPRPPGKKSTRKSALLRRPGFVPGDVLIPGGAQGQDELQYFFRGCVAASHPVTEAGIEEVLAKRGAADSPEARAEVSSLAQAMATRFDTGNIDGLLPNRAVRRPVFASVIERAKHRRREIGAFLRGLDIGHTETSHMDSHGEASLQSLMEWAARLENLAEADEPEQADYAQFHRGMDQLDNTTEALIVDVELTLRRHRDRVR